MSARAGQWSDDEIEDLVDGQHEGGDTDLVKNLRAALRAKSKEANQYKEELGKATTASRESTINDLLKTRELNVKIAKFIPPEVEATEEAVDKWLAEYGDVFGATPVVQQQGVSDEDLSAMRQMDRLAGATSPAVVNDASRAIQGANSREDVLALIRSAGGEV